MHGTAVLILTFDTRCFKDALGVDIAFNPGILLCNQQLLSKACFRACYTEQKAVQKSHAVQWLRCRSEAVLSGLRLAVAHLRCHDASAARLARLELPKLVQMLLAHWHP